MRQLFIIAGMMVLLTACTHWDEDKKTVGDQVKKDANQMAENTENSATLAANALRDNIKRTGNRIRKWWITPLPEKKKQPVAASYCYNVYQDILCYRQPMPGWEHRLAGYQGTGAEPPPPAMMIPLPTRNVDPKQLPQNRVANAQPVFGEIPADIKEEKDQEQQSPSEAVHETLPDPALAPQL
jgi:hypothetical protein